MDQFSFLGLIQDGRVAFQTDDSHERRSRIHLQRIPPRLPSSGVTFEMHLPSQKCHTLSIREKAQILWALPSPQHPEWNGMHASGFSVARECPQQKNRQKT
jgi:hypothetical protein